VIQPVTADPRMQPKSSELFTAPNSMGVRLKCFSKKGMAPVMMAMSKPNRNPPKAAMLANRYK
jgi:hypothetical protein